MLAEGIVGALDVRWMRHLSMKNAGREDRRGWRGLGFELEWDYVPGGSSAKPGWVRSQVTVSWTPCSNEILGAPRRV